MKHITLSMLKSSLLVSLACISCSPAQPVQPTFRERVVFEDTDPERVGPNGGFADIVEKASPSVVSVASEVVLQRYFRDRRTGDVMRGDVPVPQGIGSGVIVSKDGLIITNNHVVENADRVVVRLKDGKEEIPAKVLGTDPATDLAVLKIEGTSFPAIPLANSERMKVGDTVLAIGSPFGLQHTVTSGIISALGRKELGILSERGGYENFIQTDAAINPGNSGGALIDNRGRLIGINTAIFSRTGANVGIGFAIPTELVMNVASQLAENGRIRRGYVGVVMGEVDEAAAREFGLPAGGVVVRGVERRSPADQAGLKPGDVIVSAGGQAAESVSQVRLFISQRQPGETLPFTVRRDGKELKLQVTTAERPNRVDF
jgi:Do/DeqQ family serine protease